MRYTHALGDCNHLERGKPRCVPVENDQVRRPLRQCRNGGGTAGDDVHVESRITESAPKWLYRRNVLVDYQNLLFGFGGGHGNCAIWGSALYRMLTLS